MDQLNQNKLSGEKMLEKLLNVFGVRQAGMVVGIASNVVNAFETEYAKDHDVKLAAYDALIAVLQHHRDSEAKKTPTPTEAPPSA